MSNAWTEYCLDMHMIVQTPSSMPPWMVEHACLCWISYKAVVKKHKKSLNHKRFEFQWTICTKHFYPQNLYGCDLIMKTKRKKKINDFMNDSHLFKRQSQFWSFLSCLPCLSLGKNFISLTFWGIWLFVFLWKVKWEDWSHCHACLLNIMLQILTC